MNRPNSPKLRKWVTWLDLISDHIVQLHHDRAIWREMLEALNNQSCGDYVFEHHYTKLYVDASATAVRRLAEVSNDKDAASLGNLVKEISDSPDEVRMAWFLGHYATPSDSVDAAHQWSLDGVRSWARFGSPDGGLDVALVDKHLSDLSNTVRRVKTFADRLLAHLDRRGVTDLPTFDDLDASIDVLGDLFRHYALLLTGSSWMTLAPTIQSDWKRPFRTSLFDPINARW